LSLLRKIKEAIPQNAEHTHHLEQLESVIPKPLRDEWTKEVEAWEDDSTNPNPLEPRVKGESCLNATCKLYSPRVTVLTQNEVRLALASRDAEMVSADRTGAIHCEITGSMMIYMGLELEEQQ
jgi:hypothetical protein